MKNIIALVIRKSDNTIMNNYQMNVSGEKQIDNVLLTHGGNKEDYTYIDLDKDTTDKFVNALRHKKEIKYDGNKLTIEDVSAKELSDEKKVKDNIIKRKKKISAQKELDAIKALELIDINEDYSKEKNKLQKIINDNKVHI